ncbi:MAG: cytochrome c [Anaerolineales bacterium]|uniref:Cytochrome c n=1 Tax=Candidatus Desulfolinea nitratireducens TaxID=2841698 RepID=A0A8J6NL55_9CHLR|nr:cytochrome c [Candidatus Desulfolinea nitratireducens]
MEVKHNIWRSLAERSFVIILLSGVLLTGSFYQATASPKHQSSDEGQGIFEQKCISCHSIGGGIVVGPDLEGVLDRRDRDWVASFISAPDQILADGDPIATGLLAEFNGIPMPNLGLPDAEVESLLTFFEGGESVAPVTSDPLPSGKISRGEGLFTGGEAFDNGGTPCIACHTVGGVGLFGGGSLGPDLTHVFQRYGEVGLASSIQNIAFPTMQGVYAEKALSNQEIADLLAFFAAADSEGKEGVATGATSLFWGAGLLGAGVLFGVMAFFWPKQRENLSDRLRRDAGITSRRHS